MSKRTTPGKFARRGLTLVEVIVVTAIITVLVSLTALIGRQIYAAANRRSSEVVLESLGAATDRYRTERGYWPWQEYTGLWEVELTRKAEPGGGTRNPYFQAGAPVLRERAQSSGSTAAVANLYLARHQAYVVVYDHFGMVQNAAGAISFVSRGNNWNEAGNYARGANWGAPTDTTNNIPEGIRLNLPNSAIGLANQGMPVFQSAGPDGQWSGFVYDAAFENTDDVFSHCGVEF